LATPKLWNLQKEFRPFLREDMMKLARPANRGAVHVYIVILAKRQVTTISTNVLMPADMIFQSMLNVPTRLGIS
jgi:hypothetical protein